MIFITCMSDPLNFRIFNLDSEDVVFLSRYSISPLTPARHVFLANCLWRGVPIIFIENAARAKKESEPALV